MHQDVVLAVPREPWLDRLRRDHRVWLVKENRPAIVAWAWEPPDPGTVLGTGRIAIQPLVDNHVQPVQVWYADVLGRGINRSQLFAPIEGQLPAEASPISEPVVRQLMRTVAALNHRIEQLEGEVHAIRYGSMFM
jgi:hypothetical protein